jgi:hypothetical protein
VTQKAVRDIWKRLTWTDMTSSSITVKSEPDCRAYFSPESLAFEARKRSWHCCVNYDESVSFVSVHMNHSSLRQDCFSSLRNATNSVASGLALDLPIRVKSPTRKFSTDIRSIMDYKNPHFVVTSITNSGQIPSTIEMKMKYRYCITSAA